MAVKIGSARGDENGKATGGKAGDQKGGAEVSTQDWYAHSKGWVMLRPKDAAKATKIAKAMKAACANNKIGYDQGQRNTLYNAAKPLGFDCSKVTTACETDCSALVRVCCAYAGITVGDFTTSDQATKLMATGEFTKHTASKYNTSSAYLRTGDILVTKAKGHTVVVLSDGSKAHTDAPDSGTTGGGTNTIVPADPMQTAPQQPATLAHGVRITGGLVNLRTGPGTDYAIVDTVRKGEIYEDANASGWYPILVNGRLLWVSNKMAERV